MFPMYSIRITNLYYYCYDVIIIDWNLFNHCYRMNLNITKQFICNLWKNIFKEFKIFYQNCVVVVIISNNLMNYEFLEMMGSRLFRRLLQTQLHHGLLLASLWILCMDLDFQNLQKWVLIFSITVST